MTDDPRVRQLVEEVLDSAMTPEETCRGTPELLAEVLEEWRKLRALEAQLGLLFPESGPPEEPEATNSRIGLPRIPGHEVGEVLGRGGVGVVYKAEHLGLRRAVALKMLLAGAFATRSERQRFAREAEVVAGLRHPNIVQVYDVGDLDGRPYFTMEFIEGGSLAERIAGTPRPALEAAELVATLANAIDAAHRRGIVHRDLKPSNVLLAADGTPKITDFGLARQLGNGSALTLSGAAMGTPSYMAPEQALGKTREVGPLADLYALGAILYELLTGRPPFRAESAAETVHQVITRDPVAPSRLNAKVPRDLETICLKCLRKDPPLRYADAASLADDLRRFRDGKTIAARPENRLQRLARGIRRRPGFSAAIATITLLAATLAIGGVRLVHERESASKIAQAELAEIARAADGDLREMVDWQLKASWPEARAALARVRDRIGNRGSAELRRRIDMGARELALVARLEDLRMGLASSVGGRMPADRTIGAYESAFREAGLGEFAGPPEAVAGRIKASNIKGALVAVLDECALLTGDIPIRGWLADAARLAEEEPAGWRDRVRRSARWMDRETLARLIESAPADDQSVPLLIALAKYTDRAGGDALPFLKRVHQAHPGDFWVNLELGKMLRLKGDYAEALRYLQAATTIRPGAGEVSNEIGSALRGAHRFEEAVGYHLKAVRTDPTAAQGHHNLALVLQDLNRFDEAIEHSRIAARLRPEVALVHAILGISLDAKGRLEEAIGEYRRALELNPKLAGSRGRLRGALVRLGRSEEARVAWAEILADNPPGHDDWYGYAELCLFLGLEDEYRRARSALLDRFGDTTDLYVAERTARACLLRPASDDEEMRRIVALGERAWGADRSNYSQVYPHFQFVRGLADYRQGRLDRALSIMRGDAVSAMGPSPRLVVALALHRVGRPGEAREALAAAIQAHDWRADQVRDQDGWIYHTLRREAEALIVPNLARFLDGTYEPLDIDERLAMLGACQSADRSVASTRLFADPRMAATLDLARRHQAAQAAARAGCGRGSDAAKLNQADRGRWRARARDWLRAELASWREALDGRPTEASQAIRQVLPGWQGDPDLAGLRDPAELDKWPSEERKDCLALWAEVNALIDRAGKAR